MCKKKIVNNAMKCILTHKCCLNGTPFVHPVLYLFDLRYHLYSAV